MNLLEATCPSAAICPVDMRKIMYKVTAVYLPSLKTEEDQFQGISTYDGAGLLIIMHMMKPNQV